MTLFVLSDWGTGLVGFNLQGKTIGIIGTGRIGLTTAKILSRGFSSKVIAYDPYPNEEAAKEYGFKYTATLDELLGDSDIVSLHCPLTKSTHHLLNHKTLSKLKPGAVLVNVARGALINTKALIQYAFPPDLMLNTLTDNDLAT